MQLILPDRHHFEKTTQFNIYNGRNIAASTRTHTDGIDCVMTMCVVGGERQGCFHVAGYPLQGVRPAARNSARGTKQDSSRPGDPGRHHRADTAQA